MTHQPAISFSNSFHIPFNRAGGRTSNVVQNKSSIMKRLFYAVSLGVTLALTCIGLVYISNLFGPRIGDDTHVFLHKFSLQWFLAAALPGLIVSIGISVLAIRMIPRKAVLISVLATTILAVALPAPAIMGFGWTGELRFIYMALSFLIGCLIGWSCSNTDKLKEAQQAAP